MGWFSFNCILYKNFHIVPHSGIIMFKCNEIFLKMSESVLEN